MTLTTETLNLWRNNAEITAGETAEDDPEHISAKAILALTAELLANRDAQPVGYFVRHRSAWDRPSKWRLWTECSAEDYAEFCKIIATGDADAGRFYEASILYDAPSAPARAQAVAWEMRYWNSGYNIWHDWERITAEQHAEMSVQYATDNDYEFRVLYDAPPARAVPGELFDAMEEVIRISDRDHEAWDKAKSAITACRAAMLENIDKPAPQLDSVVTRHAEQPVSGGYKLPDNVREALTLALQAMEFMGDTLNNIDAVCTEDVEYVTPAFNAVRELLAAAPEGGNDNDTRR